MAFLGTSDLIKELPSIIVEEFKLECIINACYNLRLGNEVYVTNSKRKKKEILDNKNPQTKIEPGQFALLITLEKVKMPQNYIGFISLRFSLKRRGLVNVSGFHIDPGFQGKIIFSVYNAGPATIYLEKGKPYFSMWLSELKSDSEYKGAFDGQTSIGADYLNELNGDLPYPGTLLKRIERNSNSLKQLISLSILIISILIATIAFLLNQSSKFNDGYNYRIREEKFQSTIDSLNKIHSQPNTISAIDSSKKGE